MLGKKIHPMCKVRGVPGTHDVDLGLTILDSLNSASHNSLTSIPFFSKLEDKHKPEDEWIQFRKA